MKSTKLFFSLLTFFFISTTFAQTSLGLSSPTTSTLDVVVQNENGQLSYIAWTGKKWSKWRSLESPANTNLSVQTISVESGRTEVIGVSDKGSVYHAFLKNNKLSDWQVIKSYTNSFPEVVSWGKGRFDILTTNKKGEILQTYFSNGKWSKKWNNIGGDVRENQSPSVVAQAKGKLDIFYRSKESLIKHKSWNKNAWSDWETIPAMKLTSPVVAASVADGRLDLFTRGSKGELEYSIKALGQWGKWTAINKKGSVVNEGFVGERGKTGFVGERGSIHVHKRGEKLDIFYIERSSDLMNNLMHATQTNSGRSEWQIVTPRANPKQLPSTTSWTSNRTDISFLNGKGELQQAYFNGKKWSAFRNKGRYGDGTSTDKSKGVTDIANYRIALKAVRINDDADINDKGSMAEFWGSIKVSLNIPGEPIQYLGELITGSKSVGANPYGKYNGIYKATNLKQPGLIRVSLEPKVDEYTGGFNPENWTYTPGFQEKNRSRALPKLSITSAMVEKNAELIFEFKLREIDNKKGNADEKNFVMTQTRSTKSLMEMKELGAFWFLRPFENIDSKYKLEFMLEFYPLPPNDIIKSDWDWRYSSFRTFTQNDTEICVDVRYIWGVNNICFNKEGAIDPGTYLRLDKIESYGRWNDRGNSMKLKGIITPYLVKGNGFGLLVNDIGLRHFFMSSKKKNMIELPLPNTNGFISFGSEMSKGLSNVNIGREITKLSDIVNGYLFILFAISEHDAKGPSDNFYHMTNPIPLYELYGSPDGIVVDMPVGPDKGLKFIVKKFPD